jgi:hypothetical protein
MTMMLRETSNWQREPTKKLQKKHARWTDEQIKQTIRHIYCNQAARHERSMSLQDCLSTTTIATTFE